MAAHNTSAAAGSLVTPRGPRDPSALVCGGAKSLESSSASGEKADQTFCLMLLEPDRVGGGDFPPGSLDLSKIDWARLVRLPGWMHVETIRHQSSREHHADISLTPKKRFWGVTGADGAGRCRFGPAGYTPYTHLQAPLSCKSHT